MRALGQAIQGEAGLIAWVWIKHHGVPLRASKETPTRGNKSQRIVLGRMSAFIHVRVEEGGN